MRLGWNRGDEARFDQAWQLRVADATTSLSEALALADELQAAGASDHDLGRCKLLEASSRWRLSQYTEALGSLLSALELLDPEDGRSRAAVLLDLATVRTYFGLHDEALELLLEALSICEELDDLAGRGNVYNNLGIVFWNRGDLDEAKRAYNDSLEVRRSLDDQDGVAACHNNLGKVFTEAGDHDHALGELQAALDGWEQVDNPRGIGVALNNIGMIYHRRGESDLAVEHYERSLEVKVEVGDRQGVCETRTHLGRILTELGRTDDAQQLLKRAVPCPWPSWTSMSSSRSTMTWDTPPAMRCCVPSRACSATTHASPTFRPATAARSSRWCSRTRA